MNPFELLDRVIESSAPAKIPAGFKLVPIEPDYDMLRRAQGVPVEVSGEDEGGDFNISGRLDAESARAVWKEMLAAVRTP